MSGMMLSECGAKAVEAIINQIEEGNIALPSEIPLKYLEDLSGCRV